MKNIVQIPGEMYTEEGLSLTPTNQQYLKIKRNHIQKQHLCLQNHA